MKLFEFFARSTPLRCAVESKDNQDAVDALYNEKDIALVF